MKKPERSRVMGSVVLYDQQGFGRRRKDSLRSVNICWPCQAVRLAPLVTVESVGLKPSRSPEVNIQSPSAQESGCRGQMELFPGPELTYLPDSSDPIPHRTPLPLAQGSFLGQDLAALQVLFLNVI